MQAGKRAAGLSIFTSLGDPGEGAIRDPIFPVNLPHPGPLRARRRGKLHASVII
jgi:hypothetical protein